MESCNEKNHGIMQVIEMSEKKAEKSVAVKLPLALYQRAKIRLATTNANMGFQDLVPALLDHFASGDMHVTLEPTSGEAESLNDADLMKLAILLADLSATVAELQREKQLKATPEEMKLLLRALRVFRDPIKGAELRKQLHLAEMSIGSKPKDRERTGT